MQTTNQIHQRRETTELSTYELRNGVGYSTPNEQRGYTPPPTPEPFTPPRVSASAVKVDGSVVEQAHASFTHAKTAFEKFLNDIPREHRACGMSTWCARRRVRDRLMSHEHLVRAKRVTVGYLVDPSGTWSIGSWTVHDCQLLWPGAAADRRVVSRRQE